MNRIGFHFLLWMYFLAAPMARAQQNPLFLKPETCGPKSRAPSEYVKELNHRFRTTFGHGPAVHDAAEEKIVGDTFRAQGKEVLCEMLAFEVLSPFGWHGDTSKKEEPTGAAELAKSLGLEDFYKKTRQAAQGAKQKIQNTFNKHVESGLVRVAEKMQDLQSAQGRLHNEKEIIKERQALEETFRKELPYANHPFLRDYYNFIITHSFNKATHPTRADLPGRVRTAMEKGKSFFEVEVLRPTRGSLEGEAKTYHRMQTRMSLGGGDGSLPDAYRITLGQLGAFSGDSADPKETAKLKALDSWYNFGGRAEVTAKEQIAATVADLGASMVPVAGDVYSVGTEIGRFAEQINSCNPEYPMGFRTGVCESLQAMSQTAKPAWTADFFGSAPDLINCNWKTAMQAGAVVGAAVPFLGKGLKVLRVRKALKLATARAHVEEGIAAARKITAAEASAARGAKIQLPSEAPVHSVGSAKIEVVPPGTGPSKNVGKQGLRETREAAPFQVLDHEAELRSRNAMIAASEKKVDSVASNLNYQDRKTLAERQIQNLDSKIGKSQPKSPYFENEKLRDFLLRSHTTFSSSTLDYLKAVQESLQIGGTVSTARLNQLLNNLQSEMKNLRTVADRLGADDRASDLISGQLRHQTFLSDQIEVMAHSLEGVSTLSKKNLEQINQLSGAVGRLRNDAAEIQVLSRISKEEPLLTNVTLNELFGKDIEPTLRGHEIDGITGLVRGEKGKISARGPIELIEVKDFQLNRSVSGAMWNLNHSVKTTVQKATAIEQRVKQKVSIKFVFVNGISEDLKFRLMKKYPKAQYHIEFAP